MELPLPLNHIFVDYENVQAIDLAVIGKKGVTFTLLVGPDTKKLDMDLVEQLFAHAASVELIRLKAPERNALDFALAYYVGRAVVADPTGFFHIISKDKGYDPLITHLRSRHIRIRRHHDCSELTFSATFKSTAPAAVESPKALPTPAKKKTPLASKPVKSLPTALEPKAPIAGDPLARVLEHLRTQATNRPKTRKTLVRHLSNWLRKQPPEGGIEKLIEDLIQSQHIAIDAKDAVTYNLSPGG